MRKGIIGGTLENTKPLVKWHGQEAPHEYDHILNWHLFRISTPKVSIKTLGGDNMMGKCRISSWLFSYHRNIQFFEDIR